ncbi:MAG: metal ABC transporter solute-binding protein, Zn/Mn family [Acidimicrobiales bacterium]
MILITETPNIRRFLSVVAALFVLTACGDDQVQSGSSERDRPTVVVTTNILGDVVENLVGQQFEVVTIMPVGADPHDFQPSAQQVAQIADAHLLIVNGAGFEESLLDVIESAEADGVPVFEAMSVVDAIEFGEEGHGDEDDDHDDEHDGADPHFFTDPARMAEAADGIRAFLVANVDGVDVASLDSSAAEYIGELETLDVEVESLLAAVPAARRVMVTNHEVFGYFAERYGFEVVGTVIPGGTTSDSASARELAELAELIAQRDVPAIFADVSSTDELARTVADEIGDIDVVDLFSESLGPDDSNGATYLDMIRTNARRIADALAG